MEIGRKEKEGRKEREGGREEGREIKGGRSLNAKHIVPLTGVIITKLPYKQ